MKKEGGKIAQLVKNKGDQKKCDRGQRTKTYNKTQEVQSVIFV